MTHGAHRGARHARPPKAGRGFLRRYGRLPYRFGRPIQLRDARADALDAVGILLARPRRRDLVDPKQHGVVDDALARQEVAVLFQLLDEDLFTLLANADAFVSVLEVDVLEGDAGVVFLWRRLPANPRAFQVVAAVNLEGSVEHVGHDHEVQFLDRSFAAADALGSFPHAEAVQAQEADEQRPWLAEDVVVVAFEHLLQEQVLLGCDCLEHVVAVGCVVEEGSALALRRQLRQRRQVPKHHVAQQLLGPDGPHVDVVVDAEALSYPLEDHRGVVHEPSHCHALRDGAVEDVGHPRDDAELLLHPEVARLQLSLHLMLRAPHGHPDANHHADHHVPILVAEVDREALPRAQQPVFLVGAPGVRTEGPLSPGLRFPQCLSISCGLGRRYGGVGWQALACPRLVDIGLHKGGRVRIRRIPGIAARVPARGLEPRTAVGNTWSVVI
mmetsp:Transcript_30656/g.85939  ORF Transcript_30656/g.85939 Transcript_30656/m.85939 type:complete len:442 (+) Transcript_30656:312-1637(+)